MLNKESLTHFGINVLLLVCSSLLFALAQPNFIVCKGLPVLAYFIYIPLFILVRRISFFASFGWGGIYGFLNYFIFGYWLWGFHPLAIYIVTLQYFFYYALTVPLLKVADICFPRYGYLVQWILWLAHEYLKTIGFLGFSYGVTGYSQWSIVPLIQLSAIFGIWGVSALVVFPSAWLAASMKAYCRKPVRQWLNGFSTFARQECVSASLWLICFICAAGFGSMYETDYSQLPKVRIALIQPNTDPWQGTRESYWQEFSILRKLSDKALADNPAVSLVVWPETAFVPRIDWHYRYREDREMFALVHELLQYLNAQSVPFLIGNDDAVKEGSDSSREPVDYNAALLFKPKVNILPPHPDRYRKMHLVPFTEHFPYKRLFPAVYQFLIENDTHFWAKGTDAAVLSANGLRFSVPICFEDTFGYISRQFALNGAKLLVNMSNDAWAHNTVCQYQHLSMAVFRAVETGLPMVRATASGQTAVITPHGRISAMLEPFTASYLCAEVPMLDAAPRTPYVVMGDIFGIAMTGIAALLLIIGGIKFIVLGRKKI